MTKETLLSFNVGTSYIDCLKSFKRELIAVLTTDGRIEESDLIIKENFSNIHSDGVSLKLNDKTPYDDFYICIKNRLSGVLISIDELDVRTISINLKCSEKGDDDKAWSKRSLSEIISQGDIVETFIVWLQDANLTQWAKECFILRESQVMPDPY